MNRGFRITSYNVCYTKLLRIISLSTISFAFSQAKVQIPLASSVKANFGVDGDLKSGKISFNIDNLDEADTDDWFQGPTGNGVIDTTDFASIAIV